MALPLWPTHEFLMHNSQSRCQFRQKHQEMAESWLNNILITLKKPRLEKYELKFNKARCGTGILFPYPLSTQVQDGFVSVGASEHSSQLRLQWQKYQVSFPGVHGSAIVVTGQTVPRAFWEPWLLERSPDVQQPLQGCGQCGNCCEKGLKASKSVISIGDRRLWQAIPSIYFKKLFHERGTRWVMCPMGNQCEVGSFKKKY